MSLNYKLHMKDDILHLTQKHVEYKRPSLEHVYPPTSHSKMGLSRELKLRALDTRVI